MRLAEEPETTAMPINHPSISECQSTTEKERESLRLEEDLGAAARNARDAVGGGDSSKSAKEGKLGYSGLCSMYIGCFWRIKMHNSCQE